jgi:hypothetical protein
MKKEEIYVVINDEEKRNRAIQILTDAGEKIDYRNFKLSEILKLHSVDKDWFLTTSFFSEGLNLITLDQLEQLLNPQFVVKEIALPIEELQKQAELLGFELVKKERKIKAGDFGKFWDDDENRCVYGFLTEKTAKIFKDKYGTPWDNFAHLTDEEKQQIQENW